MDCVFIAAGAIFFIFDAIGLFFLILRRRVITLLANGAFEGNNVSHRISFLRFVERKTGLEPATNSLEGCDSTN
jgi:hypothetical protein